MAILTRLATIAQFGHFARSTAHLHCRQTESLRVSDERAAPIRQGAAVAHREVVISPGLLRETREAVDPYLPEPRSRLPSYVTRWIEKSPGFTDAALERILSDRSLKGLVVFR